MDKFTEIGKHTGLTEESLQQFEIEQAKEETERLKIQADKTKEEREKLNIHAENEKVETVAKLKIEQENMKQHMKIWDTATENYKTMQKQQFRRWSLMH